MSFLSLRAKCLAVRFFLHPLGRAFLFLLLLSTAAASVHAAPLVHAAVRDNQRVFLPGHIHPNALSAYDVGAVPADLPMAELSWVFKRSAEKTAAMNALMQEQQAQGSTHYQQWLTPEQFGAQFGADGRDLTIAVAWLRSHGFTIGEIPAGGGYLPFSGTAAMVSAAFGTPIHYFLVDGKKHFANTVNPQIPRAFQPLVAGIVGLHDFRPTSHAHVRQVDMQANEVASTQPIAHVTSSGQSLVGPQQAAKLYNLRPVYQAGINGTGMKIAVAAVSDLDVTIPQQYWTNYGVSEGQQLTSIAVSPSTDPHRTGDSGEFEAYIDAEVIGGLAPGAQIIEVRDTSATTAILYAIDHNLAPVLSASFGSCEKHLGSGGNSVLASAYQQAVIQGMTIVVSTGDSGVANCDDSETNRTTPGSVVTSGLSVNGLASTPYDTAVGGTELHPPNPSSSITSYTREIVWNDSCGDPVAAASSGSYSAYCSSQPSLVRVLGAGGGVSSCIAFTAGGACNGGYKAPFWQVDYGVGQNTRAVPDVSMLAKDWIVCDEDHTCSTSGAVETGYGTSLAAPAFAAIALLRDQSLASATNPDGRQGNINPKLYLLGSYQQLVLADVPADSCNADLGSAVSSFCFFRDIQSGGNDQPCNPFSFNPADSQPASSCVGNSTTIVQSNGAYTYYAGPGYDFASGLGSVNAATFVSANLGSLQSAARGTSLSYLAGSDVFTVWRPSTGGWYSINSAGATSSTMWGAPTDLPVVGDFDGDLQSDVAVWRPSTGTWYIVQSGNGQVVATQWGASTDTPVAGDFDGDGRTDIAVWRGSTGYWYIVQSSNGQTVSEQWGTAGDIPVVGDFDGDGKSDLAVWRPSTGTWYIVQSSSGQIVSRQWGSAGDIPVVGDFDGDGKSDIAVWRPSTGYWYILQSSDGQIVSRQWGQSGDVPASRDYDNDGRADLAVFRPSTGTWYVVDSGDGQIVSEQWGAPSDEPINASQVEH